MQSSTFNIYIGPICPTLLISTQECFPHHFHACYSPNYFSVLDLIIPVGQQCQWSTFLDKDFHPVVSSLFPDRRFLLGPLFSDLAPTLHATGNEPIRITVFIPWDRTFFCRIFVTIFAHVSPVGVIIMDYVS